MKILFFAVNPSTFVLRDFKILTSKYTATYFKIREQSIFNSIKLMRSHDIFFFWFASIRFFIPFIIAKILGKKIIIITGGFDVAKVPELKYGSMYFKLRAIVVRYMLNYSNKILSVSESNKNEAITNCGINPENIEMIYHGFEDIGNVNINHKSNIVITIAFMDEKSFYRKGIDRFLKLAEHMKDIEFHLIGRIYFNLNNITIPNNVIVDGYLEKNKFINLLESAKIYVQFSRHEGFGCSVAESMQYGCIPVISDSFALPEVVGDSGLIIKDFSNYEVISSQIRKLLNKHNHNLSLKCIERIKTQFNYETRANKIINIIDRLS